MVIIGRVVTVRAGFEQRAQIKRVGAQRAHMRQPAAARFQAVKRCTLEVIAPRRSAKTERINMVEDGIGCPVRLC